MTNLRQLKLGWRLCDHDGDTYDDPIIIPCLHVYPFLLYFLFFHRLQERRNRRKKGEKPRLFWLLMKNIVVVDIIYVTLILERGDDPLSQTLSGSEVGCLFLLVAVVVYLWPFSRVVCFFFSPQVICNQEGLLR